MDKIKGRNRDGSSALTRSVMKAMGIFGWVQLVNILCAVIRTKLFAIFAGPAAVALLGIYNSALSPITAATQLNFNQSAVRDIAFATPSDVGRVTSVTRVWGLRLGVFGMLVTLILSPALSLWSFGDYGGWTGFALLSVTLLLSSLSGARQAVLQGTRRLKALASASVWSYILATVIAAVLILCLGMDAVIPVIMVIFLAQWVALLLKGNLPRREDVSRKEVNDLGRRFLALGARMTVSAFITLALNYVFMLYLAREWSDSVLGCFQAGYTMVNAYIGLLFNAIVMEYYPRLSVAVSNPRRAGVLVSHEVIMVVWCLLPALCAFIALSDILLRLLYSSEFMSVLPYIIIAAVGVVLRALSWCMAYTILARGDGRTYILTETLSSVAALLLNILFFRTWGFAGLGVAYVIWYAIYTLIVGYVYRFRYSMRLSPGVGMLCLWAIVIIGLAAAGKLMSFWWIPAALALITAVPAWKKLVGKLFV